MEKVKGQEIIKAKLQENATHGSPGFSLQIYRNDFNENIKEQIPWHWHKELEFAFVTEGKAEISEASHKYILKKGEGLFLNSNVLHQIKSVVGKETKLYSVVVHPDILGEDKNFLLTSRYVKPIIKDESIKCQLFSTDIKWQADILSMLSKICTSYESREFAYEYRVHNLICEIWFLLLKEVWQDRGDNPENEKADEKRIYPALQYMQEHYSQPVALEEICRVMHVGKSECFRCFKRNLNTSPMDYLLHHRISIASMLLRDTDKTTADIALECGFNSSSYFCKVFRTIKGCSPKEYRKTKEGDNKQYD